MGPTNRRPLAAALSALAITLSPGAAGAAAGDLDCTFGTGGIVDLDLASADGARAAALQSDGKIVTLGSGGGAVRLSRFLAGGDLDPSFAGGGTVTHAFPGLSFAGGLAVDSQDRILVAGRVSVSADEEAFVARFTADGAVDTTFGGGDGWTSFDFLAATASAGTEIASAVVVDGSDRPVVGGWADANGNTFNPSNREAAIARLTTAGVLDTAFGGGDGVATASSPGSSHDDDLRALKMDGSGRFVGIGATAYPNSGNSGPRNTILYRWTAAGALDTTFDSDGVLLLDMSEGGSDDFGHDVAFDSSGHVLALGQGTDDPLLARLDATGALDTSFAGDGIVQQSFLGGQDVVEHVLVQADDKVLVTGWPVGSSSFDFAAMRFTTAGALDPSWGSGGVVTTSIAFSDRAYAALLQPNQRLILAGGVNNDSRLAMARYLNDADTVAPTTTTITADAPDPSPLGTPVPIDVSVEAASGGTAPSGTVLVGDGVSSCTATLVAGAGTTSTGSCDLGFTAAGSRTVTASFQGDDTFCRSEDTETHTVERAATTTTIAGDAPDPSVSGQPVTVSYSVSSGFTGTPTGTVTVTDGVDACTGTVAAGSCAVTLTTVGNRTLTASYSGDGTFAPSSSTGEPHTVDPATFTVGGTVSGLAGTGLVLQNDGADDLPIAADGPFTFPTPLTDGSTYSVTVLTHPTEPTQTCSVANATGTLAGGDVGDVQVTCATETFLVGGEVTGLVPGTSVTLQLNGGEPLPLAEPGPFLFPSPLADGSPYEVTVLELQPAGAGSCSVQGGSGTLAGEDVLGVLVACQVSPLAIPTLDRWSLALLCVLLAGAGLIVARR